MSKGFQRLQAPASTNLQGEKNRPAAGPCGSVSGRSPVSSDLLHRRRAQKPRPAAPHALKGDSAPSSCLALPQPARAALGTGEPGSPFPRWWRRRQGGRRHVVQRPMIFRAAPPAEHERRKCRGAAFSVPAAAPAGYITRRAGWGGPAVPRPASRLPQDALSPATPSAAAGSRPR